MSKQNKVNKNNYDQAGRLTPDELARERARQIHVAGAQKKFSERARQASHRDEPASSPDRTGRAKEE